MALEDAPNYRFSESEQNCNNCHFGQNGHCDLYEFEYSQGWTCGSWLSTDSTPEQVIAHLATIPQPFGTLAQRADVGNPGTSNLIHGQGSMFGEASGLGGEKMPYTGASDPKLPENVQALPEARREQWVAVFNDALEKCQRESGTDCEGAAFRQANGVVFGRESTEDKPKVEAEKLSVDNLDESEKPDAADEDSPEIAEEEAAIDPGGSASEDGDDKAADNDRFFIYKQDDGTYRWASISSVAIKDKEFEIVTEQAYDDAIEQARNSGDFGEIDLVHVDGTDVGKCDTMMRAGNRLVESGTFDDTEMAKGVIRALQDEPDYWGVSIKFVFDPSKFDGEKYNGNIRIKKRTILPQEMAASYGTKLVAIGGANSMEKELSEKAREALGRLNVPEEDIESLAEKQIEAEPNEVSKADEAPEPEVADEQPSLWQRIKAALSKPEVEEVAEPDADTGGVEIEEEVTEPDEVQEKSESDVQEIANAMSEAVVVSIVDAVEKRFGQQDEQIKTIGEGLLTLAERVIELQKPIEEQVEKRIAQLPKIVKARPSEVAVTEEVVPSGLTLPFQNQAQGKSFISELTKGINDAVSEVTSKYGGRKLDV